MLKNQLRLLLLASVTLATLPSLAFAQDIQVADATDGQSSNSVETVVVTARHTEEREEDVPISMSVVTSDFLNQTGSYDLSDIQHEVPGMVAYNSNPRNSSIGIRGLGVTSAQDGLDTSVGVYVDGVYLGRPGMALEDLIDVDQVEVLRGPQGTLFGNNSAVGALNITTKAPSFDPSITAEGSVGNYTYNQERFTITGPLNDEIAYRLTLYNTYRDGTTPNYTTNLNDNGIDRSGARLQFLINPAPDVSIRLIGEYSVEDDTSNVALITNILPGSLSSAIKNTQTALAETGWTPVANLTETGINAIQDMRTRQASTSAQVSYNLGWADFTSISAFRLWEFFPLQDSDSTPLDILQVNVADTRDSQLTQEFRISSKPGNFNWQSGIFIFHQNLKDHYILNQYGYSAAGFETNYARLSNPAAAAVTVTPGSQYIDNVTTKTDSVALFGQANWEIVKGLTLTAGARFTQDWRDGSAFSSVNGAIPTSLTPEIDVDHVGVDGANGSALASLTYKLAEDNTFYATFSQGYQQSGLNLDSSVPAADVVIRPELTNDYEVGVKQGLLNDRLVINADLYWEILHGYQANFYPSNGAKSYLTNVGNVRATGAEVEANYSVDQNFSVGVNGAYNEADYTSYTNAPCPVAVSGVCNLTGQPVYEAPKWVGNAFARYEFDYNERIHPYASVQYSYTSSYDGTIDDGPYNRVQGYGLANFRVGASIAGGKYDVAFWVNNAFDKVYFTTSSTASIPGASTFGISQEPGAPRMIGATLRFND
jgi:iron complex outermembrane recepter protein